MEGKRLALFDFDGTMAPGDSINALVKRLVLSGFMRPFELARLLWHTMLWRLGKYPVEKLKTEALLPLSRMDKEKAETILEKFVRDELFPKIYPKALNAIKDHVQKGDLAIIVSASPECYMNYLKEHLPVAAILASPCDPKYQVLSNLVRQEKVKAIDAWLAASGYTAKLEYSHAYGDSPNDLPMLSMVGHPRLVNPKYNVRKQSRLIETLHWR